MDELQIQNSFVKWLENGYQYSEKFSDPNGGAGAICDSIGTINDAPVLIEFKCSITPLMIEYNPKKGSSIERKIRNSLEMLHKGSFLKNWKKDLIPRIWLVAETISTASVKELDRLLAKRSHDWGFLYEFGKWSGSEYSRLGEGLSKKITIDDLQNIGFYPPMPWPGENRLPKRDVAKFNSIAAERGVADTFSYFLCLSDLYGLSLQCNRDNLNLSAIDSISGKPLNVIGIWPYDSSEQGLCVAADNDRLQQRFPERSNIGIHAPGNPTNNRGFLGPRTLLTSIDDVDDYFAWTTGIKPRGQIPS